MSKVAIKISIMFSSSMLVIRNKRGQYYHSATNKCTLTLQ